MAIAECVFVSLLVCCCMALGDVIFEANENSLQLVQVLYRHGDRNIEHSYPNDPYSDASFWPEGFGQLTNIGKMQQYDLGVYLRERYKNFLPAYYSPDTIYVRSTDIDRALMSALSNLAGLFPPDTNQTWNSHLAWQPIPVHTVPEIEDYLLRLESDCPRYEYELEQVYRSPELQKINKENEALYTYLETNSGKKVANLTNLNSIYDTFYIENLRGYKLPNWTSLVFPDKLTPLYHFSTSVRTFTKHLQRLRGGPIIKEMLQHMLQKRNGTLEPNRSMFMYSAHDTSIVSLLMALDLYNPPQNPPYAAMVIVELHKNGQNEYVIKVLFRNDTAVDPYVLKIPGCTELCPLDQFEDIVRPMIPVDIKEECQLQINDHYCLSGLTFWAILLSAVSFLALLCIIVLLVKYCRKTKQPAYRYLKFDPDESRPINNNT